MNYFWVAGCAFQAAAALKSTVRAQNTIKPQFITVLSMKAQLVLRRADRFVLHLELILSLINRCGCKLSFRCEGQPDVHEYTFLSTEDPF